MYPGVATGTPYTTAGLYAGTNTTCGLVGWMTIISGLSFTTFICSPDFRFPAAYAFARIRWIAAITSPCWLRKAFPRLVVQLTSSFNRLKTSGNMTNA